MQVQGKSLVSIYVDKSRPQWIVRDPEGNFWLLPSTASPWEQREPFDLTDQTELEAVPGHYKYLLDLPFQLPIRCPMTAERDRLEETRKLDSPCKKWGTYLSERQWGAVREDYSETGDAWDYVTHDQARSRAYRWGEDRLAGFSDDEQRLCFALALWNGKDPILKERLFGLTNSEGNHGEDVMEYNYYLDSTPTHSYLKYLYKYPQAAYPHANLIETSRQRGRETFEYELIDTGVFNELRYFDVFLEYAKQAPEDNLIQISIYNRGPEAAQLHVLPTLWSRNQWSWQDAAGRPGLEQFAYEWNFGDVNPPVHAWSTIFTYRLEKSRTGDGDREWLKSCFQKLLLNFTWWVNRKDRSGQNVFEGGFERFLESRPELRTSIHDPLEQGVGGRRLGPILDRSRLRRVLSRMLDESEFFSPYGLRSLSRYHADHPYVSTLRPTPEFPENNWRLSEHLPRSIRNSAAQAPVP